VPAPTTQGLSSASDKKDVPKSPANGGAVERRAPHNPTRGERDQHQWLLAEILRASASGSKWARARQRFIGNATFYTRTLRTYGGRHVQLADMLLAQTPHHPVAPRLAAGLVSMAFQMISLPSCSWNKWRLSEGKLDHSAPRRPRRCQVDRNVCPLL